MNESPPKLTPSCRRLVLLILTVSLSKCSFAFTTYPRIRCSSSVYRTHSQHAVLDNWPHRLSRTSVVSMVGFSFAEDLKPEADKKEKEDPTAPFNEGSVVRIAAEGLKAYQVAKKGYGSFDEDKKFVPVEEGGARYLQVPVGLRGVVSKAYRSDDISANFPVQVKFEPGQHVEEGYDPPVPFLFHLSPKEVEVVE